MKNDHEIEKKISQANHNDWLGGLRPQVMERISHYEKFLDKWGIIAQTGIEQEFYPIPKDGATINEVHNTLGFKPTDKYFNNSPYIEAMYREVPLYKNNKPYELAIGVGNEKGKKSYPHNSLTPSSMVRVVESANKLIVKEASKHNNPYNTKTISFDAVDEERRLHAQQINISLWDKQGKPLFNTTEVNELAYLSIKNLLHVQHELIAVFTVSPNAYQRFNGSDKDYDKNRKKEIIYGDNKFNNPSTMYRNIYNESPSNKNYIENRLGHADMPPSVNVLITLAAVAKGVEEYIEKYNIRTSEELHNHLEKNNKPVMLLHSTLPRHKIPQTRRESLSITENSKLAKEILGGELHKNFTQKYKQQFLQNKLQWALSP